LEIETFFVLHICSFFDRLKVIFLIFGIIIKLTTRNLLKTIKGPAIFLAQFLDDEPPFNDIMTISKWASDHHYKGIQVPTWDLRAIDLDKAASSAYYCEEWKGKLNAIGVEVVELASYLQGQAMGMPPVYQDLFSAFYPKGLNDADRVEWAQTQLKKTVDASLLLGTDHISVLSGGLAWPFFYPWPQRSAGLIDLAFEEMAKRWLPVLNYAAERGITFGYELHPGSDLFDGATYMRFLEKVNHHPAACVTYDASHFLLQQMDYLAFIDIFHERIKAFHVKDAEFRPNGMTGVYGGYHDWKDRAGRFRSLGDGMIDFKQIFTKLSEYNYDGWAILEWECCIKSPQQGAKEGAAFIKKHIIEVTDKAFDDFAKGNKDEALNRKILGI
jgi:sugar phosphate isomerase/epimerase